MAGLWRCCGAYSPDMHTTHTLIDCSNPTGVPFFWLSGGAHWFYYGPGSWWTNQSITSRPRAKNGVMERMTISNGADVSSNIDSLPYPYETRHTTCGRFCCYNLLRVILVLPSHWLTGSRFPSRLSDCTAGIQDISWWSNGVRELYSCAISFNSNRNI